MYLILLAINKLNITALFKTLAGGVLDELALLSAGTGAVTKPVGWFCIWGWLRESLHSLHGQHCWCEKQC